MLLSGFASQAVCNMHTSCACSVLFPIPCRTAAACVQVAALSQERDELAQKYAAMEISAAALQQQDEDLKYVCGCCCSRCWVPGQSSLIQLGRQLACL